jgi:hypothetical protein
MKFPKIIKRLTGVSTPLGGLSWATAESDAEIVRRSISFLEDRRVLFNPYEYEDQNHCIASVIEIRRFLTHELGRLDKTHPLYERFEEMRAACREFLDEGPGLHLIRDRNYSRLERPLRRFRRRFLPVLGGLAKDFELQLAPQLIRQMESDSRDSSWDDYRDA